MRVDIDSFREIFDTLTRNRSRTLLTGFGVFWDYLCSSLCSEAVTE